MSHDQSSKLSLHKSECAPKEGQLVSALLLLMPRLLRGCHWISPEDSLKLTTAFLPCTCKHQHPFRNTTCMRGPSSRQCLLMKAFFKDKGPHCQGYTQEVFRDVLLPAVLHLA